MRDLKHRIPTQGPEHLYFLLELALGGELYATYHRKGLFGKEVHAKFYVAGVVIAFDHLHSSLISLVPRHFSHSVHMLTKTLLFSIFGYV